MEGWFILSIFCFAWHMFSPAVYANECPQGEPVSHFDAVNGENPSVFDDLTVSEINAVQNYIIEQPEFNVVSPPTSSPNSTYIYLIERMPPSKAAILQYIDQSGPKPLRYARVALHRGDLTPPVIEEYKIGPLPTITEHTRLLIAGQESLPFSKRQPFITPTDSGLWDSVFFREMSKIDDIMKKVIGYSVIECGDKCLTWATLHPVNFEEDTAGTWLSALRVVDGKWVHPIGLEFIVTVNDDIDVDKWIIDAVWFRGQLFSNMEDMLAKYELPNDTVPPVEYDNDDPNLYSGLFHRGDPVPTKTQRGPRSYLPDGRRYSVDGHHIEWQGWRFDFNVRTEIGMQVHDIRFKGERIAYELSLSEIGVIYTGASPAVQHSSYLDSGYHLGAKTFSLFEGIDCPDHATYFDFAHYYNAQAFQHKSSVCLFEKNREVPLRRHWETNSSDGYLFVQGMPGNVLVLRSVITVYNYEYILDYIFHQNGALEVSTTLSGYILSAYYTGSPADDRYGFQVFPNGLGQIHNHLMHYKVDLDILGQENQFETLDIKIKNIPNQVEPSKTINVHVFERDLKQTEDGAALRYNFDTPNHMVVYNNNTENKYGNKRGYRLLPVNVNKQLFPENSVVEKVFSFTRYPVAVTKYHDDERRGSSSYNSLSRINPVLSFTDFIADDENIVDEDLVAWVSLGVFHIPHSEDMPIVETPGLSLKYFLLPFNFFDEDPSLASRDNIRITPGKDGEHVFQYVGVSPDVTCIPSNIQIKEDTTSGAAMKNSVKIIVLLISMYVVLTTRYMP